jgi:hypothetical protein
VQNMAAVRGLQASVEAELQALAQFLKLQSSDNSACDVRISRHSNSVW